MWNVELASLSEKIEVPKLPEIAPRSIQELKHDIIYGLWENNNTSKDDMENMISWMRTKFFHRDSLISIDRVVNSWNSINWEGIKEVIKNHILLTKILNETVNILNVYDKPEHKIGMQELVSDIVLQMKHTDFSGEDKQSLLERVDAYHDFHYVYKRYYAEKYNLSDEFILKIEWGSELIEVDGWLEGAMNQEGWMNMDAVQEFETMLDNELWKTKDIQENISLNEYPWQDIVMSLFIHPEFPWKVKSELIEKRVEKIFWNQVTLKWQNIISQNYDSIISKVAQLCKNNSDIQKHFLALLKQLIIPSSRKSSLFLQKLYKLWVIDNNTALLYLEWKTWFKRGTMTMNQFIDDFGLPSDLVDSMGDILGEGLDSKQIQNFSKMIQYFLRIESEWGYNVENYAWVSSAQWYLQTLKKNAKYRVASTGEFSWWKLWIKMKPGKNWKWSSLDTRLRKLPESVRGKFRGLSKQYNLIWNPWAQSVKSLSATEQVLLNFGHIYDRNKGHFIKALNGSIESVEYLYSKIHHTKVDGNTKNLMKVAKKEIYGV